MSEYNQPSKPPNPKKTILSTLLGKGDPDTTYISDLRKQWAEFAPSHRIYFLLGGLAGLLLFLGALIVVFLLLSNLLG